MERLTKENGRLFLLKNLGLRTRKREMEWEFYFGGMEQNTKANSKATSPMEKDVKFMQMGSTTKEISKMTSVQDMGFIRILMEVGTKESG